MMIRDRSASRPRSQAGGNPASFEKDGTIGSCTVGSTTAPWIPHPPDFAELASCRLASVAAILVPVVYRPLQAYECKDLEHGCSSEARGNGH